MDHTLPHCSRLVCDWALICPVTGSTEHKIGVVVHTVVSQPAHHHAHIVTDHINKWGLTQHQAHQLQQQRIAQAVSAKAGQAVMVSGPTRTPVHAYLHLACITIVYFVFICMHAHHFQERVWQDQTTCQQLKVRWCLWLAAQPLHPHAEQSNTFPQCCSCAAQLRHNPAHRCL